MRKKNNCRSHGGSLSLLLCALMSMTFLSCDEHEPLDLDIQPGYILCSDGRIVSERAFFSHPGAIASAVVFTDQLKDGRYLAVSVYDDGYGMLCDSLGVKLGTSGSLTAYDGEANTIAMQNSHKGTTAFTTPLADAAFGVHHYGQREYIPSAAEMRELYSRRDDVNAVLAKLKAQDQYVRLIDTDDNGTNNCWYWTSTEVPDNMGREAYLFSMASGGMIPTPVTTTRNVLHFVSIQY